MYKLLKFYKVDCCPCELLDSTLQIIQQKCNINIEHIDNSYIFEGSIGYRMNVYDSPTLILVKDDTEVFRVKGYVSEEELTNLLLPYIDWR